MATLYVRLLENGATRLLESGGDLLLETSIIYPAGYRLLETGDYRLLETGSRRLFETDLNFLPFPLGFYVRKKLGKPGQLDPYGVFGIWQMRMTRTGKRPIKMKFYSPTNPKSVPQEANRAKFAAAMSAWMALTTEQKQSYTVRAKRRNMFGWGLFVRDYFMSH